MPPLFGDIVRVTLEREVDMTVVAEFDDANDIRQAVERREPVSNTDVVIAGIPDEYDHTVASTILAACPAARVLTVSTHSGSASLHELQPHTIPLGDVSPAALVDVIRQGRSNQAMWDAFL